MFLLLSPSLNFFLSSVKVFLGNSYILLSCGFRMMLTLCNFRYLFDGDKRVLQRVQYYAGLNGRGLWQLWLLWVVVAAV